MLKCHCVQSLEMVACMAWVQQILLVRLDKQSDERLRTYLVKPSTICNHLHLELPHQ